MLAWPRRLVQLEPGEGRGLVWACAYFFCLLSSYYVVRPLRDALGIAGSENQLTWLYSGTLVGTLLLNPVFGAVVSRWPRRVFIPVVYRLLTACLLGFWALLLLLAEPGRTAVGRVFFVWVSVFNLFAVSVFWGFMADLFRTEQGKRLFGLIGVGGTLGAMVGASTTAMLAEAVGPTNLLLISALLLEGAALSVGRLTRLFRVDVRREEAPAEGIPPGHGAWRGIRLSATSPYLRLVAAFLFLFAGTSTFLYFEQARIVRAALQDHAQRTALFARIDLAVNSLVLVLQCFFTGRILRGLGVGPALALLPAITLAGFAALAAAPTVAVITVFQTVRRASEYAVVRPARELLFTVVTREEKYSCKTLLDTVVPRSADLAGAWTDRLAAAWLSMSGGSAVVAIPAAAVWGGVALRLGRWQRERAARGW